MLERPDVRPLDRSNVGALCSSAGHAVAACGSLSLKRLVRVVRTGHAMDVIALINSLLDSARPS